MMDTRPDMNRNMGAYILIGLGVLFLAAQIFDFSFFGALWPLIIVAVGLPFLYGAYTGNEHNAGLIFPGTIISGTGLILFYQNLTDHWASWAYIWSLYPVFIGASLMFLGRRTGKDEPYQVGQGMVRWGMMAFVGFWALFELVIFGSDRIFGNALLPVVLIGAGLFMLFRRGGSEVSAKRKIVYTDSAKPKRTNGYNSYSEELQAKIDAALAEDDDDEPMPTKPADPSLN